MPASGASRGSPASPCCWWSACADCGSPIPGATELVPLVLISFGLANIGAELATVFNNAMMPSLVSGKRLGTLVRHRLGHRLCRRPGQPRAGRRPRRRRSRDRQDPARPAADHPPRPGDARRRPAGRPVLGALVSRVRPAAVSVHAGPAAPSRGERARSRAGLAQLVARGEGARAPSPPGRAVSARAHALCRRARRGVRLRRHLCRHRVRLGRHRARPVRHHPHHRRHHRRRARRPARRPPRLEAGDRRRRCCCSSSRRSACCRSTRTTSCSWCRSRRSSPAARRSRPRASRSISPSPS